MKYSLFLLSILLLLSISSCQLSGSKEEDIASQVAEAASDQTGDITLTREQFESSGMKIGSPLPRSFSNSIKTNGFIVASRSGAAEISTLISGRVRQIYHTAGDFVQKGATLFTLESDEIILLQQTYAVAFQELKLLQTDFDRLKALSDENVVARKDYLKAESNLKTTQAMAEGLRSRLKMIHIDPSQVEEGNIAPYQSVISPISGYITRQEIVLGQYIELNETPINIVDTDKLRLRLQVFENTIAEVATGQEVLFSVIGRPEIQYRASMSQLGKTVSAETRSIQCYAAIDPEEKASFLESMYVEAEIITCEREALALPETALIREPDRDYVLILLEENKQSYTFRKMPVQTGVTRDGFTEILDTDLSALLVEGVFGLWTDE